MNGADAFSHLLLAEPQRAAFHLNAHSATRAELLVASQRAAGFLYRAGLRRGDTLNVWLPDGGIWLQLLFACAQLGVLMVPVSTRLREAEARHVVATAQGRLLIVPESFSGL